MKLLAIDTAQAACSAAVFVDGEPRAQRYEEMRRGQSERLIPMIDELLQAAGLTAAELQAVGVTVGPGAFTGIRIGLAAARGFGVALSIPVIGITTTAAVAAAHPAPSSAPLAVALDTKRDDIYLEIFDPDATGPQALGLDEAAAQCRDVAAGREMQLLGDGAQRLAPALAAAGVTSRAVGGSGMAEAVTVGRLALARLAAEPAAAFERPPAPLYLRPPDVSLPKPGRGARG